MPSGATSVSTLKSAIETVLKTISGLKVYKSEEPPSRDLDSLPAVTIGMPTINRSPLRGQEAELGRADFSWSFPLRLYVAKDDPEAAEDEAVALVGQIVGAFDSDETLGNTAGVREAKVVKSEPGETPEESPRPMLGYVCELAIDQGIS